MLTLGATHCAGKHVVARVAMDSLRLVQAVFIVVIFVLAKMHCRGFVFRNRTVEPLMLLDCQQKISDMPGIQLSRLIVHHDPA